MDLLEARSSLLMRSGSIWQSKDLQEQSVWEFRHLTFQEYLASRAHLEGLYKDQSEIKTLAKQVAHLAAPSRVDPQDADPSRHEVAVPDSWRETLRLLVPDCRHDEVDGVLLSILNPGIDEDATISQHPRAVLAAQCLAEEPSVSEETAREVLKRFVSLIGVDDGVKEITTNVERAALEVWQSSWMETLQTCLVEAFSDASAATRANCGGVLAQLLGVAPAATAESSEEELEPLLARLGAADLDEAICAALKVVQLAHQGAMSCSGALIESLLSLLGREGSEGHAAAWALAWLSVGGPADRAKQGSIVQNRLVPPVLATVWDGVEGWGWQPNEEQVGALLAALGRVEAMKGAGQCHLIRLLGKSAQPNVVMPILGCVVDPDASVREAAREALAWMANHLPAPLQPAQLDALEEQLGAGLVRNDSLADAERCDGLVVMALFGQERLLREVLADQAAPVALRRRAAEGLGLVAYRCDDGDQRQRLRDELEGLVRSNALDLLVTGAAGWAEHDQCLPLLQGASRGLQMAASEDLPLLGVQPRRDLSMLTLTALQEDEGLLIRTEVVDRDVWRLPLPEGEHLELVVVQAGEYWIGSPEEEEGQDLYGLSRGKGKNVNVEAKRLVRLERFALARYPLTQAQWRAVASLMRLERDLNLIPSRYKQHDLWDRHAQPGVQPVESVSWNDCQEWLKRLNHWLKEQWPEMCGLGEAPQLALPSENQWEVASRAGARKPFHFGDTLDATWANYDGDFKYGPGRTGICRRRSVPVGFFGLVNRWGLAEMHGQVWEWCADQWHADPVVESAVDESPLESLDSALERNQEQIYRLLRGGSWFLVPRYCRAAFRVSDLPAYPYTFVGFRPCCLLPPGSLLGS